MTPWETRPIEVASLLNPAFCGEVICQCVRSYCAEANDDFPYALAFLVLPIILHAETRQNILPRQRMPMHAWLQSHPELKIGFAERARSFVSTTKEALAFVLQIGVLELKDEGKLRVFPARLSARPISSANRTDDGDVTDCLSKAVIVGRWFARGGTPTTVFASWGVRP